MQQTISSAIKKFWYMFLPAQLLFSSLKYVNNAIVQFVLYCITVALMFYFLKRKFPEVFQDKQRPSFKNVTEIVMLMWLGRVLTGVIFIIVAFIMFKFLPSGADDIFAQNSWWEQFYLTILSAPVLEEAYFRGIVLHSMLPLGVTNAFIINSLLFSLPHAGLANIFNAFVVGFLFTYAAYKYGIGWSIFFHALGNAFSLLLSQLVVNDIELFTIGNQTILATQLLVFVLVLVTIFCFIYFGKKVGKNRSLIKELWAQYKPNRGQLVEILKNPWLISYIVLHLIFLFLTMFVLTGIIS